MLLVNANIRSSHQLSKLQDEQAYTMMIEDFSKFTMRLKSISWVKVLPQMLHGGFVSAKTCDAVTKKFESLAENPENKFTEEECTIIRVNCVQAIKTKWADRSKLEKENPNLQNPFKQQLPIVKADTEPEKLEEDQEASKQVVDDTDPV